MTAQCAMERLAEQPPIVQQMVVFLLGLTPDQRDALVRMGDYGSIEIHWDRDVMNIYPRYRMATRRRARLLPDAD
jgi:hypothetical protein